MKTINKYLIKYDIPHKRNLNIIKINQDKIGRFIFGIFDKPKTKVLSCCNDNKIVKDSTRKVCINENNNLVIKADKQKENQNNKKFDCILFFENLEEFNRVLNFTEHGFSYFAVNRFFLLRSIDQNDS